MRERKKRQKNARGGIWVITAILSFLLFAVYVFNHVNEIGIKKLGHEIAAQYREDGGKITAVYTDEAGEVHTYDLSGYDPAHDGESVTLYYLVNVDEARPANTLVSWLKYYVLFGLVFAVSLWRLKKIDGPGRFNPRS